MSSEVRHPVFARFLAAVTERAEGTEEDELRRELLAGLRGRVIELGCGSGPNFRLYPETVSELVAVEPEDYLRAKAEQAAARAGRPGGELRFYEHVIARRPRYARFQRLAGRVTPHIAGGCHPDRDTGRAIEEAGFEIQRCRRFDFRRSPLELPVAPRILGSARRPL
jgi:SAM-dependent methyltransferase